MHFARSPLTSAAIISYSSVPTDHQSTARLYGCPSSTSGATYSGVPVRHARATTITGDGFGFGVGRVVLLGEPEVGDDDMPVLVQQDVLRLHVPIP